MGKALAFLLVFLTSTAFGQYEPRTPRYGRTVAGERLLAPRSSATPTPAPLLPTPTPTPTPSPTPSASPTPETEHVADANARLSIDPTGKVAGYRVIQDDDGLTYEFLGDGLDADAGLWLTGAGDPAFDGPYQLAGATYVSLFAGAIPVQGGPAWTIGAGNEYLATDVDKSYPWEVLAWDVDSHATGPAPTVIRNPIASEANWNDNP